MREIKFRAWDKVEKAMREVIGIDFRDETVNLIKVFPDGRWGNYWRDLKNVVLMEYTGFKDMYGRAIYEGDIVYDYDFAMRVIANKEDEMGWGLLRAEIEDDKIEVIGNIFEDLEIANGF